MLTRLLICLCLIGQTTAFQLNSLAYAGENEAGIPQITFTSNAIQKASIDGQARNVEISVTTILPRNDGDTKAALEWAAKGLAESPQAKRNVILATSEAEEIASMSELQESSDEVLKQVSRTASYGDSEIEVISAKVPETVVEEARTRTQRLKDSFVRHERVSLSLMRATVNGTVVSLGLIFNAGLPTAVALPIAIVAGALSGTVQFFNPQFQRLIDGDPVRNQEMIARSRFGRLKVKTIQLTKWFATEVAMYGILNGVMLASGAPMEGLLTESIKVIKSSLMATASQGVWDATLAENTRIELDRNEGNTEAQRRIQFRSNVTAFGVSMASVFGGVLSLAGSSLGTWSLAALGLTGGIYAFRSWQTHRNGTQHISLSTRCRMVFQ